MKLEACNFKVILVTVQICCFYTYYMLFQVSKTFQPK